MPTLDFRGKQFIYSHHLTVPFRTLEVDAAKSFKSPPLDEHVRGTGPRATDGPGGNHPSLDEHVRGTGPRATGDPGGNHPSLDEHVRGTGPRATDSPVENHPSLDENLIIHGDNLHALKALLPKYAGKIKCVYIDPPYNTGNEGWVYNDNVNSPMMQGWLSKNSPIDVEDMERHDKWLCMMWPRLHLLRELLAEDGVIFISIDDNEVHLLRAIMDEIFDAQRIFPDGNFVGQFVWAAGRKNNARLFSNSHDYILCYLKNHEFLNQSGTTWRVRKQGLDDIYKKHAALQRKHGQDFAKIEGELAAWFKGLPDGHPAKRHGHYRHVDSRGLYHASDASAPGGNGARYPVLHPVTGKECVVPSRGWVYTEQRMNALIADNRIRFGADETSVLTVKVYLKEAENEAPYSVFYKDGRAATKRLRSLLGKPFPFPKDEEVLKPLFEAVTGPDDIILDSFAGSGTTAHAVLALNKEDGGNRKFILVECEDYADTITAERVRRVMNGVDSARDATLRQGLGGSFTYCTLGGTIDEEGMLTGETLPTYENLASYIAYVATGSSVAMGRAQPTDFSGKPNARARLQSAPTGQEDYFFGETETARLQSAPTGQEDYFFGETETLRFYLIYEPDLAFLESDAAALDGNRAARIAEQCKASGKKAYVWGAHKFMSQKELTPMGITFCQLPYNIYPIMDG